MVKDSKEQTNSEEEKPKIPDETDKSEWEIIEESYKKKPD